MLLILDPSTAATDLTAGRWAECIDAADW